VRKIARNIMMRFIEGPRRYRKFENLRHSWEYCESRLYYQKTPVG
jgi:hypothetical protein